MILRPSTNGVGMLQVSFGRRKHQPRTRWRAASGSTRQRHLGSETLRRQCQRGSEGCCHRFCHTAAESKLASPQPATQVWAKGTWAASCSRALERGASAQLRRAELALEREFAVNSALVSARIRVKEYGTTCCSRSFHKIKYRNAAFNKLAQL